MTVALRLEGIRHAFGAHVVLRGIDLTVAPGEIVCLLGPSGDGKTTLLRIAAGLTPLQHGRVWIGGALVAEPGREVPPEDRGVGLLFQDFALFPHLSVAQNVGFGLRGAGKAERVREMLARVGMERFASAMPHTLSGGQQQRVALARALAPRPRVLLLDEPFSGLDARLRDRVRDDTLHVLQEEGIAVLMVTHDAEEAMFMADRMAMLHDGLIAQEGPPAEIYLHPATPFVAAFLGEVNRLAGTVRLGMVATPFGPVPAPGLPEGTAVQVLIRPEGIRLMPAEAGEPCHARARVEAARLLGRTSMVHLSVQDGGREVHIHARIPGEYLPARDAVVAVALDPTRAHVFPDAEQGRAAA
jgi:iron(III) transport system ATP-binding protein